ncbi:MAG: hypothetical protein JNG86_22130 [Verrucomicrobiaceae bacterium]|nr:hypothetical protein [Verrucomicrobiaceae bacterium]
MPTDDVTDSASPARPNHRAALWCSLAIFLLLGGGVMVLDFTGFRFDQHALVETPLATARFADGFEIRVLQAELTPKINISRSVSTSILRSMLRGSTTSSFGYSTPGVTIGIRHKNGQFEGGSLEFQNITADALMLVIRGIESNGTNYAQPVFMEEGKRHEFSRKDGIFEQVRSETPDKPENMPLHLQVEDGAGGWRDLSGPIVLDEKDGRGLAAILAFPRRKPDLMLRALRKGEAPVTMKIANPGYKPSFPTLAPQNVPVTHGDAEFTLSTEGFKWRTRSPTPCLGLEIKLEHPALPKHSLQLYFEVFDSTGNRIAYDHTCGGYLPIPGERAYRVVCRVTRAASIHPWREDEVTFIAHGAIKEPGKREVELTEEGRALGIQKIDFRPLTASPRKSWRLNLPVSMEFDVRGETTKADFATLNATHENDVAIFGETGRSIGDCGTHGSGQSGTAGGQITFDHHHSWAGPLGAGDRFRIGLIKKKAPVVVEWVLEIPPSP